MTGPHCIKTWSSTQGLLALSSAEAEYYSMVEGASKAKGIQGMMSELGMSFGNGEYLARIRMRPNHLRLCGVFVKYLWLQEEVKTGLVRKVRVKGAENPADCMTK